MYGHLDNECRIGFWKDINNPSYPNPSDLVSVQFWDYMKKKGLFYEFLYKLKTRSYTLARYRGWSTCRICGAKLGSTDEHIAKYVFPNMIDHYIVEHNVLYPDWFINEVLGRKELTISDPETLDDWIGWASFTINNLKAKS
jgi:hypothetical protein